MIPASGAGWRQAAKVLYRDTICIVGHTPTNFLTGRDHEDFRIWHGAGIIDIDCGCGNQKAEHCRLACLRLDDMAEFYVGRTGCEKIVPPQTPHDNSGGTPPVMDPL